MTIITRASKGSVLSHAEMDTNFTDLRDRPTGQVYPKTSGIGIQIDTTVPTWGWRDLIGIVDARGGTPPTSNIYRGGIRQYQFAVGNEVFVEFHLPHDYVPGTDLFIHTHWSHISGTVTSGSATWDYECSYAKGHNQAAFSAPVTISSSQTASTTQYQHMISETALSAAGGAGGLLNTTNIEVDGIILMRVALAANTINGTPQPFFHSVDIHYQSTNLATKAKVPNFYV